MRRRLYSRAASTTASFEPEPHVVHVELQILQRRAELPVYCGLRRSQIDNLIAHKEFPAPIHLSEGGRAIAWLTSEILSWQLRRIAARERGGAS